MSDRWLNKVLSASQPISIEPEKERLMVRLMDAIDLFDLKKSEYRMALAALFDLLVSLEYYANLKDSGWLYCESVEPWFVYPFTNTCPACLTHKRFTYHKANKPLSGTIGSTTSKLLVKFYEILLKRKGHPIICLKGQEPVDIVFIDPSTTPQTLFFAEIKSAPLLTLPLVGLPQFQINSSLLVEQHLQPKMTFKDIELALYLPSEQGNDDQSNKLFWLGKKPASEDPLWIYNRIDHLLQNTDFLESYLTYWNQAFQAYEQHNIEAVVYWLTNGCGQPIPRPINWRKRMGSGYESVSDSKTSVGMDRTDDIKKATYQVLKLGTLGKPSLHYQYKTGIVSNIHAVRHFDEYLKDIVGLVWSSATIDDPTPMIYHNLFDGIVTLTTIIARDSWVKEIFDFDSLKENE